jgi:tRNA G37 N-methylase Trm5
MATDINAVVNNLLSFYDMSGKSVIHVGAGGGQIIGYATAAGSVLAVDSDPEAISHLKTAIQKMGLEDRFSVVQGEFSTVSAEADVVFFEFCLHEMDDPAEALIHAQSLAPEILVFDHSPESSWAWCACEEEKAARSWAAVKQLDVISEASFDAAQYFETYDELLSKIQVMGEQAVARIGKYSEQTGIRIGMKYAIALVRSRAA